MGLPPLVVDGFEYVSRGKPVLLILPTGDVVEFATEEGAMAYLESGRRAQAVNADQSTIFSLRNGEWVQLV